MIKNHKNRQESIYKQKLAFLSLNLPHWPVAQHCKHAINNSLFTSVVLTLFGMGFLRAARRGGRGAKRPLFPKICHSYPTIMKLGTVIPYLKKIQKLYESRDTPLEFCWHKHFLPEISKFCYIKKCRYRFHLDT